MLHDTMRSVIAGDGCGRDKHRRDHQAEPERLDERKQEVADEERRETSDEPNGDTSKPTRASAVCPHTCRHAREQRQCIDGKVEQKTADDANGDDAGKNADDNHDGGLREKHLTVAPSTTTTALTVTIAKNRGPRRVEIAAAL